MKALIENSTKKLLKNSAPWFMKGKTDELYTQMLMYYAFSG